jgi:hypothetical protein
MKTYQVTVQDYEGKKISLKKQVMIKAYSKQEALRKAREKHAHVTGIEAVRYIRTKK